jgi:Histidine kinase-, DNA gyrase B-, and HSP90-like ATPase
VQNIGSILCEWELFAKTRVPAAATMSIMELSDHAEEMLRAIAEDIGRPQTEAERHSKSKGLADATDAHPTAASAHGATRHLSGFELIQVVSEFRALRAAVLRLWGLQVFTTGGNPIPPEALQVIFNPLVQVAKSKSEPHERPSTSLGLGLYIAREIVLAHGGSIEVSSTAEAGTAFTVQLRVSGP